ncbi:MAG: ABC transporter permease [Gemmatimonadetes bacterium]|nr:ABC transporter permease [Gemmatimonadota bacterium]
MKNVFARVLLASYPRDFRESHGEELAAFWVAQGKERRYRGPLGGVRFAINVGTDAVVAGLKMRWQESRKEEGLMKSMWTDLLYARRALMGAPLFSSLAVLTLALGIGATTAVFAVVDGVVLRPLPYPEPDQLVVVLPATDPERTDKVSWPDFRDWREQATGFEGLAAYAEAEEAFEWKGGAEVLPGARVTRDFFDVMGVPLSLGRTFSEPEDLAGGPDAVILSYAFWAARFDGDPDVIGRTVPIDGGSVPVVGVAAEGFSAPFDDTRYWIPVQEDQLLADVGLPTGTRTLSFLSVVGRLEVEAGIVPTGMALRALARRIDESVGKSEGQLSDVTLVPLGEWMVGDVTQTLFFLLAAAGLVLVVAAANVAGLAISRAAVRQRELAVRAALGAGRGRLLRQLMTESAVLSVAAGFLGLLLAWGGQSVLMDLAPAGLPRAAGVDMGTSTLAFAMVATLGSGLLFGLLPSLQASRGDPSRDLSGARGSSGSPRALRPQQLLVSFQFAISVVLLTGAILLTSSFSRLLRVDRGFDTESIVLATVAPSSERYASPEEVQALYAQILDEVRALPGVSSASTTYSPPLFGNGFRTTILAEGEVDDDTNEIWAGTVIIGGDYLATNGIQLLRGRGFDASDRLGEPLVVIVNQTLANRLWPGEDPLGKRFEFAGGLRGSADSFDRAFFPDEFMTVVGVAEDIRRESLESAPEAEYYRPHAQITWRFQYLMVRTAGDPTQLTERLREAIWGVDPTIPVRDVRTLDAQVRESVSAQRFRVLLLTTFAGLTCLLAMVGLYAVMALAVNRRMRETGIRIALGASRGDVMRGVMTRGLRLVSIGVLVGLGVAWAGTELLASLLSSMLFEVEATDPLTYALVVLVPAGVGLVACYLPARRASRVDPVVSLQQE